MSHPPTLHILAVLAMVTVSIAGCIGDQEPPSPDGGFQEWDYVPRAEGGQESAPEDGDQESAPEDGDPESAPEDGELLVPDDNTTAPAPVQGIRFIVWGDTGTGDQNQYRVADAAERVCAAKGCDFALNAGDNIYESGVTSVTDPQFDSKFEQPYANFTMPFYMTLGNHDNGDGLGTDSTAGDHQVAYTYRTDPPKLSDKWQMPARYYTFLEHAGNTTVQFVSLDTNTMVYMGDPLYQQDPLVQRQTDWFNAIAAASDADWFFTFAHHPYISNGEHGNAGAYEGVPGVGILVQRFFEEHACPVTDIHFAGHDHDLQWLEPTDACPDTEFIVSGAGAKTRSTEGNNPAHFNQGDTLGFFWIEIVGKTLTGQVYDVDGNVLFERIIQKES